MNRNTLFMMGIALPGLARAQGVNSETGGFIDPGVGQAAGNWDGIAAGGGRLFFALFVGVLLAFAFQWILTCLSAATGLSAAGAGTRKLKRRSSYPEDRYRDEGKFREREEGYEGYRDDRRHSRSEGDFEEKAWEKPLQKVETGIGLWVLVTVSISSFFAAWCAAELIRFGGRVEAILIGLAVWAGFMFASMWMEVNMLGSLMGNLVGAFKSGLAAVAAPFKSAAGAMASKAVSSAEEIAAQVREEFSAQGGNGGIKERLKGFTDALPSRTLDAETIRAGAENLFEEQEIREAARAAGPFHDKRRFQDIVSGRQDLSHEEQRRLCEALYEQWNRAAMEGPPAGAPAYAGSRVESRSEPQGAESGTPMPAAGTGLHRVEASGSTFSSGPYANQGGSRFGSTPAPSRVAGASAFIARFQSFKEFLQAAEKHELNPIRIEREV
jgi:hypothetical protein